MAHLRCSHGHISEVYNSGGTNTGSPPCKCLVCGVSINPCSHVTKKSSEWCGQSRWAMDVTKKWGSPWWGPLAGVDVTKKWWGSAGRGGCHEKGVLGADGIALAF